MTLSLPPLALDRSQSIPVTVQLHAQLVYHIVTGRLRPGDRLPSVRSLAAELQLSLSTLTEVYTRLESEGLVTSGVGRGTFVASAERWQSRRPVEDVGTLADTILQSLSEQGLGLVEFLGMLLARQASNAVQGGEERPVNLLFVECNRPSLEYYGDQVEKALGIPVRRALITDLPLREETVDVAVTNIYHLRELERFFDRGTVPVVGLSVMIDPQTVMELRDLPKGACVATVAPTAESAHNMRITVSGSVTHLRLLTIAADDPHGAALIRDVDVVLTHPRLLSVVRSAWGWDGQVISYIPWSDPLSLDYLRGVVERVQVQKTSGAAR